MPDFYSAGNEEPLYEFPSGKFLLFSHVVEINTRFYRQAGNRNNRKLFKTALIMPSSTSFFNKQLLAAFWNTYP
jgi:hypothetical protein